MISSNFLSVHQGDNGSDSVVPVQSLESKDQRDHHHQQQNLFVDSGYEASEAAFTNSTSSGHKVPASYMSSGHLLRTNNIPNSYSRFPNVATDLLSSSSLLMPLQFSPTNREARVLRYREKKIEKI
ncbi:conserved hypothetical protein [Ricinus communis]|uniref:Uncharacterized protein n=1 Tax=Ricinus communis TaxID=3988 RepID=B9RE81_RICCO|nr:conserved hypothetical protein [Ricinus communis]